jgi:hypothetical protein
MSTDPSIEQQDVRSTDTDWFLQSLVSMVNNSSMEFGITLLVDGMLVSGNLVGGKAYFEGFGADFATPFKDPEVVKQLKDSFGSYGEIYDANPDDDKEPPPPTFIHLKETRFFTPSGTPIPANKGVWWRGRISAIGGFNLGHLRPEEA